MAVFRTVSASTDGNFEFDRDRYPARVSHLLYMHLSQVYLLRVLFTRDALNVPRDHDGCCSGDRCYAGGEKKQLFSLHRKKQVAKNAGMRSRMHSGAS